MLITAIIEKVIISDYHYTCCFDNGDTKIEIPKGCFFLNKLPRPKKNDRLSIVQTPKGSSIYINGKELKPTKDI